MVTAVAADYDIYELPLMAAPTIQGVAYRASSSTASEASRRTLSTILEETEEEIEDDTETEEGETEEGETEEGETEEGETGDDDEFFDEEDDISLTNQNCQNLIWEQNLLHPYQPYEIGPEDQDQPSLPWLSRSNPYTDTGDVVIPVFRKVDVGTQIEQTSPTPEVQRMQSHDTSLHLSVSNDPVSSDIIHLLEATRNGSVMSNRLWKPDSMDALSWVSSLKASDVEVAMDVLAQLAATKTGSVVGRCIGRISEDTAAWNERAVSEIASTKSAFDLRGPVSSRSTLKGVEDDYRNMRDSYPVHDVGFRDQRMKNQDIGDDILTTSNKAARSGGSILNHQHSGSVHRMDPTDKRGLSRRQRIDYDPRVVDDGIYGVHQSQHIRVSPASSLRRRRPLLRDHLMPVLEGFAPSPYDCEQWIESEDESEDKSSTGDNIQNLDGTGSEDRTRLKQAHIRERLHIATCPIPEGQDRDTDLRITDVTNFPSLDTSQRTCSSDVSMGPKDEPASEQLEVLHPSQNSRLQSHRIHHSREPQSQSHRIHHSREPQSQSQREYNKHEQDLSSKRQSSQYGYDSQPQKQKGDHLFDKRPDSRQQIIGEMRPQHPISPYKESMTSQSEKHTLHHDLQSYLGRHEKRNPKHSHSHTVTVRRI
eukprot:Blabericola_migrator_1__7539@NODE_384_length_9129_cov_151_928272_g307_i0_p1_GENE_NODE_384_length_9129_cov_151_928272_g307_i0NODE_384_length_9129_cov_151_928272_g307_i0_p1_ORF_typecomplete_len648_score125_71Organ_specific/PF10950_8/12Organ_specific/PF10950_8/5_6e02_NODE_384_length_9129_cov_151_928272_g307_i071399082